METIYENTGVATEKEFCQMFAWALPKWIRAGGVIFVTVSVLTLLLAPLVDDWTFSASSLGLLAGGIYLLLTPKIYGKREYKKRIKIYGEIPPSTTLFYEDHFQVTDIDSSHTLEYRRVKRIGLLKDCITLLTEPGGVVVILSRKDFTKGDIAGFHLFLQQKCPQCKLPSWP